MILLADNEDSDQSDLAFADMPEDTFSHSAAYIRPDVV